MTPLAELQARAAERGRASQLAYAGALTPREAHELLQQVPQARLVDVRSKAEWDFVGRVPGALEIELMSYPGMVPNPQFLEALQAAVTPEQPLLFLCRSGARSNKAAIVAHGAGLGPCYNVLEGFEGDLDANSQRNHVGGWRAAGLPWKQS